jgi:hypothetical protein
VTFNGGGDEISVFQFNSSRVLSARARSSQFNPREVMPQRERESFPDAFRLVSSWSNRPRNYDIVSSLRPSILPFVFVLRLRYLMRHERSTISNRKRDIRVYRVYLETLVLTFVRVALAPPRLIIGSKGSKRAQKRKPSAIHPYARPCVESSFDRIFNSQSPKVRIPWLEIVPPLGYPAESRISIA